VEGFGDFGVVSWRKIYVLFFHKKRERNLEGKKI